MSLMDYLEGKDTPSDLRKEIHAIIKQNEEYRSAVDEYKNRYYPLYEESPISLWEEDFSLLKTHLDQLVASGICDVKEYLKAHPEEVRHCASLVKVIDVNKATLNLYKANSKEELFVQLERVFLPESYDAFLVELCRLLDGHRTFGFDTVNQTLKGEKIFIKINISLALGQEQTWSRVFLSIVDMTGWKNTQKALFFEEGRFQELVELLPQTVFEFNQDLQLTFANKIGFDVFGYEPGDIEKGIHALDVISPNDRQRAQENILRVLQGEDIGPIEYTGLRKNATTFSVIIYVNRIMKNGGIIGIRGLVLDITKRRLAEEALRESEEKYRDIFENANDLIQCVNAEGKIAYVNPIWLKTMDYSLEEAKQLSVTDIIKKDQIQHCKSIFERVCNGENVQRIETCLITKQGQEILVEGDISGQFKNGQFFLARCIFRNVTGRIKSEKAICESEERYRKLFDGAADLIAVIDPKGKLIDLNKRFEEESGYKKEEMIGKNVFTSNLATKKSIYSMITYLKALLTGQPYPMFEIEGIKKDGTLIPYEVRAVPIRQDGKIVAVQTILRNIVERKRAENVIRESEIRFKELTSSALDAIIMMDDEGNISFWNNAAEKIFGYSASEVLGKNLHLLIAPDRYQKASKKGLKEFIKTGKGIVVGKTQEIEAIRKDGTEFSIELSVSAMKLRDKWHAVGILRDITERKKAQADLYLFRHLLDQSNDAIFVIDPETSRFLDLNNKALTNLGYSREELLKRGVIDIETVLPDLASWQGFIQTLKGKKDIVLEGWHKRKDGVAFAVEISANFITVNHRDYVIAVARDMAERKRTMATLRETLNSFNSLFNATFEVIVIVNEEGIIIDANKAFVDMLGSPLNQSIGKPITDFIVKDQHQRFLDYFSISYDQPFECAAIRNDGYRMAVEIVSKEFIYQGKEARVLTLWDISLKKQMESHLLQTQKMESLGQLAAGIAHDFNNILASIAGHARLCERDLTKGTYSPEQFSKRLQAILSASERAKVLIQQLLGFSRKGKYDPRNIDLNTLIKEVSNLLDKGLSSVIKYQIKKDLLSTYKIYADGNQIHQVIQNLIVNARDAMPDGGTIHLLTQDCHTKEFIGSIEKIPAGDYVKLAVRDEGIGIEKNIFPNIFEPFFTTKEDGTGLGLSTVWGILKNHQSYIHVLSDHQGTCFEIFFPAVIKVKKVSPKKPVTVKRRKRKILVVDDDTDIRYIVEEYLVGNGYDVVLASGAQEALIEYKKGNFDLVLTDLVMSPIDGAQLFQMIRHINKTALVYIMSGYYDDERVQHLLNKGALGFIAKPFDLDQLGQTIDRVVEVKS